MNKKEIAQAVAERLVLPPSGEGASVAAVKKALVGPGPRGNRVRLGTSGRGN